MGMALLIGFFVCLFSLVMALFMARLDSWAEKKDGVSASLGEDQKIKLSDLKEFKSLPFWLLTSSCFFTYMVIFAFVANADEMLQKRFGFDSLAGTLFAIPYVISAILSPIVGMSMDKYGYSPLFILYASVMILLACLGCALVP